MTQPLSNLRPRQTKRFNVDSSNPFCYRTQTLPRKEKKAMTSIDEQILKTVKEVVVKFIECGRLSPTGFSETFQSVFKAVDETVKSRLKPPEKEPETVRKK
jgi:hypothetical protein